MSNAAQAGLYAAYHQWHIDIGFTATLTINQHRAIGPFIWRSIRRVGIVTAYFSIGGIAVHHAVHIAGGDTEIQIGLTQDFECLGVLPIGLSNDAYPKPLGFQ